MFCLFGVYKYYSLYFILEFTHPDRQRKCLLNGFIKIKLKPKKTLWIVYPNQIRLNKCCLLHNIYDYLNVNSDLFPVFHCHVTRVQEWGVLFYTVQNPLPMVTPAMKCKVNDWPEVAICRQKMICIHKARRSLFDTMYFEIIICILLFKYIIVPLE